MKTFADRAKALDNKYKDRKSSPSQMAAYESEKNTLFAEMQAQKELRGLGQPQGQTQPRELGSNQFRYGTDGPPTLEFEDPWDDIKFPGGGFGGISADTYSLVEPEELQKTWAGLALQNTGNWIQGAGTTVADWWKGMEKPGQQSFINNAANVGAAITSIVTNKRLLNKLRVPERVDPTLYNPMVNQEYFNIRPLLEQSQRSFATGMYNLNQRMGNTQDYVNSLRKMRMDSLTAQTKALVEGQRIDMAENARVEGVLNEAAKVNAIMETQADIDLTQRMDTYDLMRQKYISNIGTSLQGIFADIADAALAKRIGGLNRDSAILSGAYSKRK